MRGYFWVKRVREMHAGYSDVLCSKNRCNQGRLLKQTNISGVHYIGAYGVRGKILYTHEMAAKHLFRSSGSILV